MSKVRLNRTLHGRIGATLPVAFNRPLPPPPRPRLVDRPASVAPLVTRSARVANSLGKAAA